MQTHKARGFTLIEILIVVAVVGILTTIAYPSYRDYVIRSKISEAVAQLSDMRVKMEQFYQDNRDYSGACAGGTVAPLPAAPAVKYFGYSCPVKNTTAFTVQATGDAGQGMDGFVYTVDQAGNRKTVTTGWGTCANTPCWVLRKDCSC
jgi:type IV pilus assembly protein PilE